MLVILIDRYKTAMKFEFDPKVQKLSHTDKEQLRTVDYADALIMDQAQRLLNAATNAGIQDVLAEIWPPKQCCWKREDCQIFPPYD